MAFKTLDTLRTAGLNFELGLASDADNTWGTTTQRNAFITNAIAKLWPTMARLTRETFTTTAGTGDYTLTTLVDIERLEVMDLVQTNIVASRIRSFQHYVDEAADPPTIRLLIPNMESGRTVRAIGYAPYLIPASGVSSCDIPPRLEWVVTAGARVEAYRWKLNQFANFERFANENRANSLTPADVIELLRQAKTDFDKGMRDNARNLTGAKRAQLQTN
jgi:hypothetical protein